MTEEINHIVQEARAEIRELDNPLRLEMERAASRLTVKHLEHLQGFGMKPEIIAHLTAQGMLGLVHVVFENRLWLPQDDGVPLIVTPLEEDGVVVDLIAFNPKDSTKWAARTGVAWALGADRLTEIEQAWDDSDRRLLVQYTPLDWLRSGGNGLCVVQWNDEARRTLRRLQWIEVASSRVAQILRLELSRPPPIPEIVIRGRVSRAA